MQVFDKKNLFEKANFIEIRVSIKEFEQKCEIKNSEIW